MDAVVASDASAEAAMDGASSPDVNTPPPEDASQYDGAVVSRFPLEMSIDLAPAEEVTRCVVLRLNNMRPEFIRRMTAHLGDASHHLIAYRSNSRVERTTPFECNGFSGIRDISDFDTPLLIAQQTDTTLTMPNNVGMAIDADDYIRLEFHAVNLRATPIRATATLIVDTVDQTVPLAQANLMFWGNTQISLPASSRSTVDFFHTPLGGVRMFGLTSHTHHYGVRSTIHLATGTRTQAPGAPGPTWTNVVDGEMLHESRNWSDPPLTLFNTPRTFAAGQGLHLRCEYNNTSNRRVTYGESVDQEMCFLWAYYYPAPRGTHICAIGFRSDQTVLCFPPS